MAVKKEDHRFAKSLILILGLAALATSGALLWPLLSATSFFSIGWSTLGVIGVVAAVGAMGLVKGIRGLFSLFDNDEYVLEEATELPDVSEEDKKSLDEIINGVRDFIKDYNNCFHKGENLDSLLAKGQKWYVALRSLHYTPSYDTYFDTYEFELKLLILQEHMKKASPPPHASRISGQTSWFASATTSSKEPSLGNDTPTLSP